MELGTRITSWLKAKGKSQRALASALGLSPGAVTAWVKNEASPTNKNLEATVEWLGLTMTQFYGRVPKAKIAKSPRAKAA